MTRKLTTLVCLTVVCGLLAGAWLEAAAQDKPEIIGADKCKMCHKGEKKGAQFEKWSEGPHAGAHATLGTDAAKAIAQEKGIADPQEDAGCLSCHTTRGALADAGAADTYDVAEGVGCEACHGPGSLYKSMKVMKDREAAIAAGLIIPDEKTCTACHNEKSPTYKPFDYAARVAEIAHPIPAGD
jgi:hypothetical protein